MTDREKILAEVEKRKKAYRGPQGQCSISMAANRACQRELESIRDFILSLPAPPAPSELVRLAREKAKDHRANGWDGDAEDLERLADALDASDQKLKLAREALEFYANKEHWTIRAADVPGRRAPLTWGYEVNADKGDRARQALGEMG